MRTVVSFILFAAAILAVQGAAPDWQTDLTQALAQAQKEKKAVLLDFSGSDWCSTCIKLREKILDAPDFAAYADRNLVLVQVDFPLHKSLPEAQEKANLALKEKLAVNGFPTLVILDPSGKKIGFMDYDDATPKARRLYSDETPKAFIAQLRKLIKRR